MPEALPTINPLAALIILALLASVVGAWIWIILRLALDAPVLPRFEPKVVPWGGKSVLAVLLVWLAIQVGVQTAYLLVTRGAIARPPQGARAASNPSEMMTASALQNATVLVVIPLLLWFTCGARLRDFVSSRSRTGWQILQGMVAWPLAAPVVFGMMLVAVKIWGRESHPLETAIQNDGVGGKAVIFFLAGAVFAPAAEELIFRGVLLGWLSRLILESISGKPSPATEIAAKIDAANSPARPLEPTDDLAIAPTPDPELVSIVDDWHTPAGSGDAADTFFQVPDSTASIPKATPGLTIRLAIANLAVSILFAALHYTVWPTPVPIFFLSLALGLLYQRTGSLVAPITLHMTFNGISTILMFVVMGAQTRPDPAQPSPPKIPTPVPKPVDPITTPPIALAGDWWEGRQLEFARLSKIIFHPVDTRDEVG